MNIEDTELKKDSERERALFSDENVMKNIKLKIEQQIKEKEIQLISERNSHYRRASQDNYEWYHFSNEENESKLRNNLIIEEKNLKYDFPLDNEISGLYFIQVICGDTTLNGKLIIH